MGAARADGRAGRNPGRKRGLSPPRPSAFVHLQKRSFRIAGHRTSIALEPEFWGALEAAAGRRKRTLAELVEALDAERPDKARSLASTLRVFALHERG